MIVIDASLALAWALQEREHAETVAALDYVSEHGAYVPGNFRTEVVHGVLQAERKKRLGAMEASELLADIFALDLNVELPDPHVVVAAARAYGLSAYDAVYLALAQRLHLPLATADPTLVAAARTAKCLWKPKA